MSYIAPSGAADSQSTNGNHPGRPTATTGVAGRVQANVAGVEVSRKRCRARQAGVPRGAPGRRAGRGRPRRGRAASFRLAYGSSPKPLVPSASVTSHAKSTLFEWLGLTAGVVWLADGAWPAQPGGLLSDAPGGPELGDGSGVTGGVGRMVREPLDLAQHTDKPAAGRLLSRSWRGGKRNRSIVPFPTRHVPCVPAPLGYGLTFEMASPALDIGGGWLCACRGTPT